MKVLFDSLNITRENAYRFISGHEIYDLIEEIHEQVTKKLYDKLHSQLFIIH